VNMRTVADLESEARTFLGKVPLFGHLQEESMHTLACAASDLLVQKGQFIFLQGDPADKAYIVRSGRISILLESRDGRKLVINEMHSGDIFGDIGLLTRETRSSSAIARTDCELVMLTRQAFLKILDAEPLLVRRMLEMTALRLRESTERESALAFLDAQGRLARLLLQLGKQELEKGYITISQEELAERTGQTRQTVAKALGRWRRAGWLITGRGRIMLLKHAALAQVELGEADADW
jgi:CRP/FNR family transcriptional regulator, cyclic AMP receptor protein